MSDTAAVLAKPSGRAAGALLLACAVAGIGLLLNHPGGAARDFAGLLQEESANRAMDAVVHGGFIVVLALELIGYAALSARIGFSRTATIAGFTFFAVGAAFMMASLLIDGLMVPAIAARYVAAPDKIDLAKALFVFATTALQFLMPIGLGFQALGVSSWGASLMQGPARAGGAIAALLGLAVLAAVIAAYIAGAQHLLMVAILGMSLWALIAAVLLLGRRL